MHSDNVKMVVRWTNAHGPMSRMRQALETLVKKLRDIVKRKYQIEVLGDDDIDEESTHCSHFSLEEGLEKVSEEEPDP